MIEARLVIDEEFAQKLEDYFCEDYQEHWLLHEDTKTLEHQLRGFFESEEQFNEFEFSLKSEFPNLSNSWEIKTLEDADWKEAYKIHFKPWSERGLHWVPVWEAEQYDLPKGEEIVLLDPGMAFGTGNHETTRLCALRLLDARDLWGDEVTSKSVIDAGCGSGILAISAKKLKFGKIYAFDNDPDSIRISSDNEKLCGIEKSITFEWKDLKAGLEGNMADLLLANILANVLCDHAELLVSSVNAGGQLALSGILAYEVEEVHKIFAHVIEQRWGFIPLMDSKIEGEWADLLYRRPLV